jgi:CBS domain-containing protein
VLAKDMMTVDVVTVRPHMTVDAAAALLVSYGFTSAPVLTAEGVLRGMVSEGDLIRSQQARTAPSAVPECVQAVSEVMTPHPVTARPTDDLDDVAAALLDLGVRAVPVVEDGRLVGILSRNDILRRIAHKPDTLAADAS